MSYNAWTDIDMVVVAAVVFVLVLVASALAQLSDTAHAQHTAPMPPNDVLMMCTMLSSFNVDFGI